MPLDGYGHSIFGCILGVYVVFYPFSLSVGRVLPGRRLNRWWCSFLLPSLFLVFVRYPEFIAHGPPQKPNAPSLSLIRHSTTGQLIDGLMAHGLPPANGTWPKICEFLLIPCAKHGQT